MKHGHYKNELSAYVDKELGRDERHAVAAHLLVCEGCRREHDEIKRSTGLLSNLPAADAPENVWANIQSRLDGGDAIAAGIQRAPALGWKHGLVFAASLAVISTIAAAVYLNLFTAAGPPATHGPQITAGNSVVAGRQPIDADPADPVTASNLQPGTNSVPAPGKDEPAPVSEIVSVPSWQVETLAGTPTIGDGIAAGRIGVGQMLVTDSGSRAKIAVADIGSVEIAPGSRVKLVRTGTSEHRLALDRGRLHAKIFAPPRLFIVDTPSGRAVDLGCEYTLQVDRVGNSILEVTGGFVAMEENGRESIVPAGMMCLTRKGKGLGTPFAVDTDAEFKRALEQFDFGGGGRAPVRTLLAKADFYDMVTLWHLLSRVDREDRGTVFDRLAEVVTPPPGVTRDGILNLNKEMLANWRAEVENLWFD